MLLKNNLPLNESTCSSSIYRYDDLEKSDFHLTEN